jgi:hypothetical protein
MVRGPRAFALHRSSDCSRIAAVSEA